MSRTVPSSIYTAVPAAAIVAPNSHITNVTPTLPEARKMMLGVAYILFISFNSMHPMLVGGCVSYPVPIIRLKIKNTALGVPVGNSK